MIYMFDEKRILELILKELEKYKQLESCNKKNIVFYGEDEVLKQALEKDFNFAEDGDIIIVSFMCIRGMIELSKGSYFTAVGRYIVEALLQNKRVIIVEEGLEWRTLCKAESKISELYRQYEKDIVNLGVEILNRMEILSSLQNSEDTFNESLIDLRVIRKFEDNKLIRVGAKTRVTELAKEYAKEHNIEIVKR